MEGEELEGRQLTIVCFVQTAFMSLGALFGALIIGNVSKKVGIKYSFLFRCVPPLFVPSKTPD